MTVVLALPRGETHQVQPAGGDEMTDIRGERLVIGAISADEANRFPVPDEERGDPGAVLQPGLYKLRYMRSMASISNSTDRQHMGGRTR